MRLGLRTRSWLHALAAYGAGVALALVVPQGWMLGFVGGGLPPVVAYGLVLLAASAWAFGGIGAAFQGRVGWWHAVAGLLWLPASAWVFVMRWFTDSGELYHLPLDAALFCGLAPATLALLGYAGPVRVVGALGSVAVVIAVIVPPIVARELAEQADREARREWAIANVPRPFVGDVDGYQRWGDGGSIDGNFDRMVVPYLPDGAVEGDDDSVAFTIWAHAVIYMVVSDYTADDACGGPVLTAPDYFSLEPEVSCELISGTWERTSASGHEVARMVDGVLVRVSGPQTTSRTVLYAALDAAKLIDEASFDRLIERHIRFQPV